MIDRKALERALKEREMYLRVGQGLCSDRFNCDPTWPPARNRLLSDCEPLAPRRLHLYPPQFDLRHTGGRLCLARHLGRIQIHIYFLEEFRFLTRSNYMMAAKSTSCGRGGT